MRPVIFLVMICAILNSSYSQRFDIEFQQCYGGSNGDVGKDIFMLPDSTLVIFAGTASQDGTVSYNHGH